MEMGEGGGVAGMKMGKDAQSIQYLCICVNHQEYRDTSVMKQGLKLRKILSLRSKTSLLETLCLNLIENQNFHMIVRTIYAEF